MYICLCNRLTDHQVRRIAEPDVTVEQIYLRLGCRPQCGKCIPVVRDILASVAASPLAEKAV
ncbi:MAG TPA: (2Fe-2S)-binding protein [Stellaceae bacterium]|nr:(2Fe-2S)-binding protein [Stellaceae bacterium]